MILSIYLEYTGKNCSISSFCNNTKITLPSGRKILYVPKNKIPDEFSEGLGKCSKIKATFELKDNAVPVFKLKRSVPFAALESINK